MELSDIPCNSSLEDRISATFSQGYHYNGSLMVKMRTNIDDITAIKEFHNIIKFISVVILMFCVLCIE